MQQIEEQGTCMQVVTKKAVVGRQIGEEVEQGWAMTVGRMYQLEGLSRAEFSRLRSRAARLDRDL
ncbi:MAG: hypothetical protein AB1898_27835 [Acidobacteriota bacterium]